MLRILQQWRLAAASTAKVAASAAVAAADTDYTNGQFGTSAALMYASEACKGAAGLLRNGPQKRRGKSSSTASSTVSCQSSQSGRAPTPPSSSRLRATPQLKQMKLSNGDTDSGESGDISRMCKRTATGDSLNSNSGVFDRTCLFNIFDAVDSQGVQASPEISEGGSETLSSNICKSLYSSATEAATVGI